MSQAQPVYGDLSADDLIAEMAGLEARAYAEIGVPTFFVAEDLTVEAPVKKAVHNAADRLVHSFAQLADALVSRKPDPDVEDIGKLIEIFADRHFLPNGPDTPQHDAIADEVHPLPSGAQERAAAPAVIAQLADGIARSRAIRAVNFHATPRYREQEFRDQIAAYAQAFEPITPANFDAAVDGEWPHARPGMLPMLFEGFRDNLDVLLPILEEHGFVGFFFIPPLFLNIPAGEQRDYAAGHELFLAAQDEYPGERVALTWDEARAISRRGHVFACHSRSHFELMPDTPPEVLRDEIVRGKAEMEAELDREIDIFCWLGGAEIGFNPAADAMLREAGFRYLFSNFKIQKLR